jgi:hypothetical protein
VLLPFAFGPFPVFVRRKKSEVEEIAMSPHLSNLQFLVAIVVLALVACLALAAIIDIRRRRKTPPFLNYFYSNFDQDQYDRDSTRQTSFSGLDEWRAYNRSHAEAFEGRHTTAHHTFWE